MKKFLSMVLAVTVILTCLSGFAAVSAEESIEALTLSVKQRLEISEEYTKLSTNRYKNGVNETVSFQWSTENDDWIAAEATADGVITYFSDSQVDIENGISAFTNEEACAIANAFMQKINPGVAEQYVFLPEDVVKGYGIRLSASRYVNGVRVAEDNAHINMNSLTGGISYCSVEYTKADLPKIENIISLEEAAEKFNAATELMLVYANVDGVAKPIYIDYMGSYEGEKVIDAVSGEFVEYERSYLFARDEAMKEFAYVAEPSAAGGISLTPAEIDELSKYDQCITEEEAVAIIKNTAEFGVSDYELSSISYEKSYIYDNGESKEDGIIVRIYLEKDETVGARAYLDAETGEILGFYSYNETDYGEEITISEEQSDKIADGFMEKAVSGKIYEKMISINSEYGNGRTANYLELVDGIPYLDSCATVTVDMASGKITSYNADWERGTIEFAKGEACSEDVARQTYFENSEYELVYNNYADYGKAPDFKLNYVKAFTPYCIDAVTGTPNDLWGKEYREETGFTDISGHWAEQAINALMENGYLSADSDTFRPDENITADETQELMNQAGLYRYGKNASDGDATLSREEAVKEIICGAGYEQIGALADIYIPVFADWQSITPKARGYVALAKGLGIVGGDQNGCFNPSARTSRASFAVMIYNYIKNGGLR